MAINFWQNLQFDLALGGDGGGRRLGPGPAARPRAATPYGWAAVFLVLLALSPLLALSDGLVRPLAKSQYVARTVSGLIIATMVVACVAYRCHCRPCACRCSWCCAQPEAARRFLTFAFVMLLAGLPADLYLTQTWVGYLDAMRTSVQSRGGVIPVEDTPLGRPPYSLFVEDWVLHQPELLLRDKPTDGVLAPPRSFKASGCRSRRRSCRTSAASAGATSEGRHVRRLAYRGTRPAAVGAGGVNARRLPRPVLGRRLVPGEHAGDRALPRFLSGPRPRRLADAGAGAAAGPRRRARHHLLAIAFSAMLFGRAGGALSSRPGTRARQGRCCSPR